MDAFLTAAALSPHEARRAEKQRIAKQREAARDIVTANGFAAWRPLVDKVLKLLNIGHSKKFAGVLLKKTTPRLPDRATGHA